MQLIGEGSNRRVKLADFGASTQLDLANGQLAHTVVHTFNQARPYEMRGGYGYGTTVDVFYMGQFMKQFVQAGNRHAEASTEFRELVAACIVNKAGLVRPTINHVVDTLRVSCCNHQCILSCQLQMSY